MCQHKAMLLQNIYILLLVLNLPITPKHYLHIHTEMQLEQYLLQKQLYFKSKTTLWFHIYLRCFLHIKNKELTITLLLVMSHFYFHTKVAYVLSQCHPHCQKGWLFSSSQSSPLSHLHRCLRFFVS